MTILDKIIAQKKIEVAARRVSAPIGVLEQSAAFGKSGLSLKDSLLSKPEGGFITEFKRSSPSKGSINNAVPVADTVAGYQQAGSAGISVLTDNMFFGGSEEDLRQAKQHLSIPVLRKDFIIDEYQVIEAKAIGADVILLIAAALTPNSVKSLASLARAMDMEVLLELHDRAELDHICDDVAIVGVNNRNLKDFSIDLNHSFRLLEAIPASFARISESGISHAADAVALRRAGFDGFLIGSGFMQTADPAAAFGAFLTEYKTAVYAAEGVRAQ